MSVVHGPLSTTGRWRDSPAAGSSCAGRAYYCDCTREQLKERTGSEHLGYDGFCRDRGLAFEEGRALRFRTPDEGETVVVDLVRGEPAFPNSAIEDFVIARGGGSPVFLIANVVDDLDRGNHAGHPGRGAPVEHAEAAAAVGGARCQAAHVGAPAGDHEREAAEAVQAPRQGGRA